MLDSKNSNGQVDLGDWFFAQMIGEITQASLEAQAADWEMEVTLKSNQTFTFKELTWLYDFESGGTWQYSNVDNIAIQLDLQDVGIIDGRLVHGQLQLIAIEPNSKIEFPLAVMTKCWW